MSSIKDWLIEERQQAYGKLRDIWLRDCRYANSTGAGLQFSHSSLEYMDGSFERDNSHAHFYLGYIYGIINNIAKIEELERHENNA
jgi:hypothetical protein